jgi:hypothetical protein
MIDTADTSPGQGAYYFGRLRIDKNQFLPQETQDKEKFSRDEIINAFNSGYQRFETTVNEILTNNGLSEDVIVKWKNGEELTSDEKNRLQSLDVKTKKRLSDFLILTTGKKLTLDQNKDAYLHSYDGYSSKEGVPVEGLLDFLHDQIQEIKEKANRGGLTEEEAKRQITSLYEKGHILYKSSRLASRRIRVKRGADAVEGTIPHARARAEAKYISEDPLRRRFDLSGDEKLKAEFLEGIATMQNRRELRFPKVHGTSRTRTPVIDDDRTVAEGDRPSDIEIQDHEEGDRPSTLEPSFEEQKINQESTATSTQSLADIRREFYIVNRSLDVRKRAAEIAETQLREEMRRGKWYNPKDFFRRVKLRLAEEYYRQKYKDRALKAMLENNNSYLDFDCVRDAVRDANHNREGQKKTGEAVISQLKTGELIAGQQVKEAQGTLKTAIIEEIIKPIIDGKITDENKIRETLTSFVEAHQNDPDVQAVFGRDTSKYKVLADFFATDLLEMGKIVKEDISNHQYALDQIDQHTSIKLANSVWGAETEANFNFVDKAVAWAQDKPWKGSILNPASIGAITSLAYSAVTNLGRSTASRKLNLIAPGIGSLVGGGFAAARRWHDLQHDIASHRAEMAYGFDMAPGSKRREAIEKLNYNTASINDLIAGGGKEITTNTDREAIDQLLQADLSKEANRQKVIQRIAEISQRLDLSVSQHIDLITAQGSRDVLRQLGGVTEQESLDIGRMELVKQIARMKIELRKAGLNDNDLTTQLNQVKENWKNLLLQNKEQQDKEAKIYKLKQAALSGVFGSAVGMASYFGTQEVMALGERALGMNVGETHLEHILGKLGNLASGRSHAGTPTIGMPAEILNVNTPTHIAMVDGHQTIIPNGTEWVHDQSTNKWDLILSSDHSKILIDNASFNANGTMVSYDSTTSLLNDPSKIDFGHINQTSVEKIVWGTANHEDLTTGFKTMIPNGTHWVHDTTDQTKWDLVMDNDPSKILVNDAVFNRHGIITDYDAAHSLIKDSRLIELGKFSEGSVTGKTIWEKAADYRVVHAKSEVALPIRNSTFSTGDPNNPLGVRFEFPDSAVHNPNTGLTEYLHDAAFDHRLGILLQVPHYGSNGEDVGIFVPGHWDSTLNKFVVDLNPSDTSTIIKLPNGGTVTMAELAQNILNKDKLSQFLPDSEMTYESRAVFNLANPDGLIEHQGRILAGYLDPSSKSYGHGAYEGAFIATHAIHGSNPLNLGGSAGVTEPPVINGLLKTEVTSTLTPPKIPPIDIKEEFISPVEAPGVPIPWAPRWPLEELFFKPSSAYYGIYSSEISDSRKKLFEEKRSSSLKKDPKARLDPQKEVLEYFGKQSSDYMEEIAEIAKSFSPPSNSVELVICIPVAGHQEGKNIYTSLENYLYQDALKDKFEIQLFVNYPEKDLKGNVLNADETLSEIERFKKDHPDFPITVITKKFPREKAKIGYIRKYETDIALYRYYQLSKRDRDLIIVSNDADLKGISPNYISNFIEKFNKKPEAEGFLGQLDWDPEAYVKYPLIHIGTRLFQYLGAYGRRRSNRMPSSGANFAFRSSIYAGIGGYIPELEGGEDIAIGQAIIEARKSQDSVQFAGARVSRLYTSARRAIQALSESGLVPVAQWDKGFSPFDDEVRRLKLDENIDINYDDPEQVKKLKDGLEYVIDKTLDIYESGERLGKNAKYYKDVLRYLGIQYDVDVNNRIVITNIDSIIRNLKHYKEIGILMRDLKAHRGSEEEMQKIKEKIQELENEYINRIQKEDFDKTKEINKVDKKIESELTLFHENKFPLQDVPRPKYSLEELKKSEDIEEIGNFIICQDKVLGSGTSEKVLAGYNKNTGKIYSFKRIQVGDQAYIAKVNDYPDNIIDVEDYINSHVDSPLLGTNKEKIEIGPEKIKIYPIASQDLNSYLMDHKELTPEKSLYITISVAEGVRELHKLGILHLDLSPTNILLNNNGIKIIDFDSASIKNKSTGKYTRGFIGGFRHIIPPELFVENPKIDQYSDTYELAILLYRLIVGYYPYDITAVGLTEEQKTDMLKKKHLEGKFSIPETVPESIQNIIKKGIQPNPGERYQNMNEMLLDLLDAYAKIKS